MKLEIKVLGGGCANCDNLMENAKLAVQELGLEAEFLKVTDKVEIAMAGVMSTPALVINNEVKSTGRVVTVEGIKEILNA